MSVLQALLLGVLQGIAEFLPISSSGHLQLVQKLFGLEDVPLLYDVFLHLATLLAVFIFFRKKIWELLCSFFRLIFRRPCPTFSNCTPEQSLEIERNTHRYILGVILATIVTGVIGIVTSKLLGSLSIKFVFAGFLFTSLLLILSAVIEKRTKKNLCENSGEQEKAPSWKQSLLIGLAQGIGTLPGVSRSGSTISGALFCGVNRSVAGEFSFIASIPAILGAFILEAKDLGEVSSNIGFLPVLAGCLASFVSGYFALACLMKIIRKGKLEWFAAYLIPLGIIGLCFI